MHYSLGLRPYNYYVIPEGGRLQLWVIDFKEPTFGPQNHEKWRF